MTPKNIKLGPGNIYIQQPEGLQQLYTLDEAPEREGEEPMWPKENPSIVKPDTPATLTAELELTPSGAEFFRNLNATFNAIREIVRRCIELLKDPRNNKRVRHLALHARKLRTRKKNMRRLAREAMKWELEKEIKEEDEQ